MIKTKKNIYKILTNLPLFKNPYLSMQAHNIAIVDDLLEQMEARMWHEYIMTEKTPFPIIMMVSAVSQMWIFALYELFRTWKQMLEEVIKYNGKLKGIRDDPKFEEKKKQIRESKKTKIQRSSTSEKLEDVFYNEGFRQVETDESYAIVLQKSLDIVMPAFRTITDLRVTLAKHEIPGAKGVRAYAPGYARIDSLTGSLCWLIEKKDGNSEIISRANLAESIRKLKISRSRSARR